MRPLELPLKPPFYEMGGLRVTRAELRAALGLPHHVEQDSTRTAGGEEETWAFALRTGPRVAVVLKVPYNTAVIYSDSPDKGPLYDLLKTPAGDERWALHPAPVFVPRSQLEPGLSQGAGGAVTVPAKWHWGIWRQDDNGNRFEVASGLSREDADKMLKEFEERGHKQAYWLQREGSWWG